MEAILCESAHRTPEFRQYVHLVWGYGTLIGRALDSGEDPRSLLDALVGVTERATVD